MADDGSNVVLIEDSPKESNEVVLEDEEDEIAVEVYSEKEPQKDLTEHSNTLEPHCHLLASDGSNNNEIPVEVYSSEDSRTSLDENTAEEAPQGQPPLKETTDQVNERPLSRKTGAELSESSKTEIVQEDGATDADNAHIGTIPEIKVNDETPMASEERRKSEEVKTDIYPNTDQEGAQPKSTLEDHGVDIKLSEDSKIADVVPEINDQRIDKSWDANDQSEVELTLEEYEQKLRKNITEALDLVNELCNQNVIQENVKPKEAVQEVRREFGDGSMLDADSYRLNPDSMKEPICCVLLPDNRICIGDDQLGLLIFNLESKELQKAENNDRWRRPKAVVYVSNTQHLLVLMEFREDNGAFENFICRFTMQLEYVNRIEAPKFIKEKGIISFKMCYAHQTGNLYLAANTMSNAFLYELTSDGKWTEVYNSRSRTFLDVQVFAVIHPVTELIILESTSYVRLISVYGSDTVDKRTIAVCEKPGALCVEESGGLFVFNRASGKIAQHSRLDFLKMYDVAVFDRAHCQLSAYKGLISALNCPSRDLRLYKYYDQ